MSLINIFNNLVEPVYINETGICQLVIMKQAYHGSPEIACRQLIFLSHHMIITVVETVTERCACIEAYRNAKIYIAALMRQSHALHGICIRLIEDAAILYSKIGIRFSTIEYSQSCPSPSAMFLMSMRTVT